MKIITIFTNLLNGTEEEVSLNLDAIEIYTLSNSSFDLRNVRDYFCLR